MKCKYCNGTGEHINDANRMTTCEFCGGTGEVEVVGDSVTDVCDKCGGTGFFCEMRTGDFCTLGSPCPHQKPLTNEQWFCQLHTTEKSEFLSAMVKQAIKVYEIHGCTWHETVSWWDGWLKEKHHDK